MGLCALHKQWDGKYNEAVGSLISTCASPLLRTILEMMCDRNVSQQWGGREGASLWLVISPVLLGDNFWVRRGC